MTTTPSPLTHILVVDDDARLRRLLAEYLGNQGWVVTVAQDAEDAKAKLALFIFDLLVLDVMMPGMSGADLARELRDRGMMTPILMLTAMAEAEDRIDGLEAGADDYLVKPFEPRELVLRIQNILRRNAAPPTSSSPTSVSFGRFTFLPTEGRLLHEGVPVHLTSAEQNLLSFLAHRAGEPVSRSELAACLSGDSENERSIDVQITRLRKKIEADPSRPLYIQTIRGSGYILRAS